MQVGHVLTAALQATPVSSAVSAVSQRLDPLKDLIRIVESKDCFRNGAVLVLVKSEDVLGELTQLCEVRFLDIQVCFTGRDGYHRGLGRTCIAKEFAKHKSVSVVFAWSGKTGYKDGYCYSTRFWGAIMERIIRSLIQQVG